MNQIPDQAWFSPGEVATLLQLDRKTVVKMVLALQLPHQRLPFSHYRRLPRATVLKIQDALKVGELGKSG